MKSLIQAVAVTTLVAAALAAPLAASAQTNSPVTRAQVRAELAELVQAGYQPGRDDPYYPRDIQAAEAKVAAQHATTGVGGVANGSSDVGSPARQGVSKADWNAMYDHP
jgi:hypothetical protein